ncbi:MAG: Gfo/Idh/MocA family oxidoreductase [Pseudomonadota bacterium]
MISTDGKLRVGVVGAGSMGRHHVRILAGNRAVTFSGLYDPDPDRGVFFCRTYGCSAFDSLDALLERSDAVSVAAPTSEHLSIGLRCVEKRVHVMMEKPLADSGPNARRLVEAARERGIVLMVGHVERYNPAVRALMDMLDENEEVVSIDCRRLAPFDGSRCLDVDVLYDLLIHDVDLALEIADSPIVRVSAAGRPIFSHQIDVAHARIEFLNGTVAVFRTSKCSPKKVRSFTVSTPCRYLEADTLADRLTVSSADSVPSIDKGACFMAGMRTEEITVPKVEPLKAELDDFIDVVQRGGNPLVNGERALRGLEALESIKQSILEGRDVRYRSYPRK